MGKQLKADQFDPEWKELILEALAAGLTPEEIREFFTYHVARLNQET